MSAMITDGPRRDSDDLRARLPGARGRNRADLRQVISRNSARLALRGARGLSRGWEQLATAFPAVETRNDRYLEAAIGTLSALVAARNATATLDEPGPTRAEQEDAETIRLITEAKPGDKALARPLYDRYVDRVYSYLELTFGDRSEAEEVTQEVFVTVLKELTDYDPAAGSFRAWLFRIARSAAIDRMRRHRRLIVEGPGGEPSGGKKSDLGAINDRELLARIAHLSRCEQQMVVLRYLFELGDDEIAELLERSPEATRELHGRAMRSLREQLSD